MIRSRREVVVSVESVLYQSHDVAATLLRHSGDVETGAFVLSVHTLMPIYPNIKPVRQNFSVGKYRHDKI